MPPKATTNALNVNCTLAWSAPKIVPHSCIDGRQMVMASRPKVICPSRLAISQGLARGWLGSWVKVGGRGSGHAGAPRHVLSMGHARPVRLRDAIVAEDRRHRGGGCRCKGPWITRLAVRGRRPAAS